MKKACILLCFFKQIKTKLQKFFILQKRYYGHITSLGYNCEVSFQFFKKFHFTESGLFSWCSCPDIKTMINAINNLEKVGIGKITPQTKMWLCQNTNILFHGKGSPKEWENPTPEFLKQDLEELKSRLAYLKKKLLNIGKDGKNNLYIYKCTPQEAVMPQEELINSINTLYQTLKNICSNTFDLLIIFEKNKQADIDKVLENPHIFVRRVNFFTNAACVTSKPYDKRGWGHIFNEFKPNFKLTESKHYKFEDL